MSFCSRTKFNPEKIKYIKRYIHTKVDKNGTVPFGFTSSIDRNGKTEIYTYGKRNIEQNLPFRQDSIYRMASQSKFMGVTGFLKLIDRGLIDWNTPLKTFIPEYSADRMGVIQPYTVNGYQKTLLNPLLTKMGSNRVFVAHTGHPFKFGDRVSLEWSNGSLSNAEVVIPEINGIPGFEMYNIHEVIDVSPDGYSLELSTPAVSDGYCGNFVKICQVGSGVRRSICFNPDKMLVNPKLTTYYYKLIPLKRELTVLDVLNHGLGWSYYSSSMLYMSFGYAKDTVARDIQSGVWNEIGLPIGLPLSCYTCGIQSWCKLAATVPLLYQPGEDWSYGPQLSLLGSIIETVTGQSVENYMKTEIWEPLGMKDTGFFIQDSDPEYHTKKDRVAVLYVNMPKIVMKFIGEEIPFPPIHEAQTCMYEGPRNLCLIDCGMYTTVSDYLKFMKMYLNRGRSDKGVQILSDQMIDIVSTYHTPYDVSNLATVSSYSTGLSIPTSERSEIQRKRLLSGISWGLGVGTIPGCQNNPYLGAASPNTNNADQESRAITWAGVLGTRFIIDFCSGVAYNAGTNVIGPPAGLFDSDLVELNYKEMTEEDCDHIILDFIL